MSVGTDTSVLSSLMRKWMLSSWNRRSERGETVAFSVAYSLSGEVLDEFSVSCVSAVSTVKDCLFSLSTADEMDDFLSDVTVDSLLISVEENDGFLSIDIEAFLSEDTDDFLSVESDAFRSEEIEDFLS